MASEPEDLGYEVMIRGQAHPWSEGTISVADIRELGGLSKESPVLEEDLRTGTERILSEDETVRLGQLEEGKRTVKRHNFREG